MPKLVLSYRRSDVAAMAGRIFDRLRMHYGDELVFMDIDDIPIGVDFRQHIRDILAQADILIAVIGPRWRGPKTNGGNRIDDATDPVRVEIEGALERGIPVVPILIDDAQMPSDVELPDTLKNFAFINAATVDTGRDYRQHMDRLIRAMDKILAARAESRTSGSGAMAERIAAPLPPDNALPIDATIAAQPEPEPEPALRPPPVSAPPTVPSDPQRVEGVPAPPDSTSAEDPASSRRRLYAAVAIFAVLGIGLVAAAIPWSQDTRSVPPTAPTRSDPAPRQTETAPTLRWKLQNTYPALTPTTLPFLSSRVGELSGGRMQLELLSAGAVVPASELLDAVHSGILDLGYGQGSYLYGKNKAAALMTAVPFGFTAPDQLAFRRRPDVKAAFDELIAGTLKLNVVALPCGAFGRNGEFWLRRPLRAKSDLVGKKLRFVGLTANVYRELGTAVTVLPGGEIVAAIDRGLLDGGQFSNPRQDLDLGFADVVKYYYHPSSVGPAYVLDLYLNKDKWQAMPPAGRQIFEQACREAADAMVGEQERLDREALAELARRGVSVAPVPAAVERDLYAASEKVLTTLRFDPSFDRVMKIVDQLRSSTLASKLR